MNVQSFLGQTPLYIRCKDALGFFSGIDRLGRRGWIFRGHSRSNLVPGDSWSSSEWKLESSLWRHLKEHSGKIIKPSWYPRERDGLRRFKQVAPNYLNNVPDPNDELSWLALMQHYGAPTRLLDFTFNPAAALFFALRGVSPKKQPWCVHAIRVESIRGRSFYIRQNADSKSSITKWPRRSDYNIGKKPRSEEFVGVIDGSVMNARQAAQEGLFLVPSRIDLNLEKWLQSIKPTTSMVPYGTHWLKFVFENVGNTYYNTLKQLMQMGMSPLRLFPALEGLCEAMRFTSFDVAKDFEPGAEPEIAYTSSPGTL